jgi:hypothetical protein
MDQMDLLVIPRIVRSRFFRKSFAVGMNSFVQERSDRSFPNDPLLSPGIHPGAGNRNLLNLEGGAAHMAKEKQHQEKLDQLSQEFFQISLVSEQNTQVDKETMSEFKQMYLDEAREEFRKFDNLDKALRSFHGLERSTAFLRSG